MKHVLKKYFVILSSLYIVREMYSGLSIAGGWQGICYGAFLLGILLYLLKPIVSILLFPLNFLTLNLTSWLTHIIIVSLWVIFTPYVTVTAWQFTGGNIGPVVISPFFLGYWQSVVALSLLIILVTRFINWLVQ